MGALRRLRLARATSPCEEPKDEEPTACERACVCPRRRRIASAARGRLRVPCRPRVERDGDGGGLHDGRAVERGSERERPTRVTGRHGDREREEAGRGATYDVGGDGGAVG